MTPKDIKAEIKRYRRLKLKCRASSSERLDLEHKIKDFKRQLAELTKIDPEKEKIIAEILKYGGLSIFDKEYYSKFSISDLKKHLENLKEKKK